jgi:hypothetical protein
VRHGAERTPEGRSLRLLRQWLSPSQRAQFAEKGYFEVVGADTGKQYRIYVGTATNVCEIDEKGRPKPGCVSCRSAIFRSETSCSPRGSRWKAVRTARSRWPEDSLRAVSGSGKAGFLAERYRDRDAARKGRAA